MTVPLTRKIGEFIAGMGFAQVPEAALPTVRNGFADYAAVAILGRDTPVARLVRSFATVVPDGGEARLCFTTDGAAAIDAALINGVAGHALDYDDIGINFHPAHPTVVLASAILSEAERLERPGRDIVAAYVTGYEVWGELARRGQPTHLKGWHPTGTFGAVAAAAAVAGLRRLDAETASHAVGIAASRASGIVANYGSMTKPYHAGHAARTGIVAARLAEAGMTASADAIENERGFLMAVSPSGDVDRDGEALLGARWWIVDAPLGFKLYPMCYGSHRAISAMLDLIGETPFRPEDVEEIVVEMGPKQIVSLVNHDPKTGLDGKFSIEFAMAMTVIAGRATLAEVTDEFIRRDDVRAMMKRVRVALDPAIDPVERGAQPDDAITVVLADGRRLHAKPGHPYGHPARPLDAEILWDKFADCVGDAMPVEAARELFERLQAIDTLGSLDELPLVEVAGRRETSWA